jgi:hypothetical protein
MAAENSLRRRWTEEETILALYLYFQLPFGKLHSGNPEIRQLAEALDRRSNSIAMKLCNFASLDPKITESGRKGLAGASKQDRELYAEFGHNWSALVARAETFGHCVSPTPLSRRSDTAPKERVKVFFRALSRGVDHPGLGQPARRAGLFPPRRAGQL